MADRIATVQDAIDAYAWNTDLPENKCVTVKELSSIPAKPSSYTFSNSETTISSTGIVFVFYNLCTYSFTLTIKTGDTVSFSGSVNSGAMFKTSVSNVCTISSSAPNRCIISTDTLNTSKQIVHKIEYVSGGKFSFDFTGLSNGSSYIVFSF